MSKLNSYLINIILTTMTLTLVHGNPSNINEDHTEEFFKPNRNNYINDGLSPINNSTDIKSYFSSGGDDFWITALLFFGGTFLLFIIMVVIVKLCNCEGGSYSSSSGISNNV